MYNDKPRCVYSFWVCVGRSRLLDWFGRAITFGFWRCDRVCLIGLGERSLFILYLV
ncbi:hypothetical protein [Nostoc sp. DSM 114167]|uniref:hypothetical protein n=1 Tax=Nostoc sp. DSM 114167 TaxID=3439050 RepID=UPI004045856F